LVPPEWKLTDYKDLLEAAVAVTTLLEFLGFKFRRSESATPHTDSVDLSHRHDMLKLIRARWITGFLEKSLGHKSQMDLRLVEVSDALGRLHLLSRIPGEQSTPVPAGTPIRQIFDEHAGQLLILGAPGAGKTTLLLKLAAELLSCAETTDTERIPVIFTLSTWSAQQPPIADWLVAELHESYRVPKKIAKGWVENNQIMPLLDGLDEVLEECRQACVVAINRFRREKGPPTMAVCCRTVDYKAIASKLELEGAVAVQPLARAEVSSYLEKLGKPMVGVRQLLHEDQTLWELLETPLMVDTIIRAYEDQPVENLKVIGGLQEQRNHLFKAYVNRMFQHRGENGRYQRERTLNWLSWLANQLFKHNITDFYIERLQVD
jgi:NACHT domain